MTYKQANQQMELPLVVVVVEAEVQTNPELEPDTQHTHSQFWEAM